MWLSIDQNKIIDIRKQNVAGSSRLPDFTDSDFDGGQLDTSL